MGRRTTRKKKLKKKKKKKEKKRETKGLLGIRAQKTRMRRRRGKGKTLSISKGSRLSTNSLSREKKLRPNKKGERGNKDTSKILFSAVGLASGTKSWNGFLGVTKQAKCRKKNGKKEGYRVGKAKEA